MQFNTWIISAYGHPHMGWVYSSSQALNPEGCVGDMLARPFIQSIFQAKKAVFRPPLARWRSSSYIYRKTPSLAYPVMQHTIRSIDPVFSAWQSSKALASPLLRKKGSRSRSIVVNKKPEVQHCKGGEGIYNKYVLRFEFLLTKSCSRSCGVECSAMGRLLQSERAQNTAYLCFQGKTWWTYTASRLPVWW